MRIVTVEDSVNGMRVFVRLPSTRQGRRSGGISRWSQEAHRNSSAVDSVGAASFGKRSAEQVSKRTLSPLPYGQNCGAQARSQTHSAGRADPPPTLANALCFSPPSVSSDCADSAPAACRLRVALVARYRIPSLWLFQVGSQCLRSADGLCWTARAMTCARRRTAHSLAMTL